MAERVNDMDPFEQQLKKSLEHYAVPYNSADWSQMERALSSGVRGWGHGRALMAGLLVAGGLLIGGTAYFLGRDTGAPNPSGANTSTGSPASAPAATVQQAASEPAWPSGTQPGSGDLEPRADLHPANAMASTKGTGERSSNEKSGRTGKIPHAGGSMPSTTAPAAAQAVPSGNGSGAGASLFRTSVHEACPGSPVDFTVEHMPEDGIYLWNFGDGSFSNKPNPQHTFTKPGSYQVMLSMSNTGMGSIHNKPSSDMIVIHEAPAASFNVVKQEYPGLLPSVHFENRSLGAKSYQWDLGDGTMSTEAHPDHIYKAKGVYKVELTVTNETGCEDRKMKEVRIDKDFNLGAATSFSPNGDGMDETFMPQALPTLTSKFQLAIYDPAGILVYSTTDASHPWCGRMNNDQGAACAPGDYVWVVDVSGGRQAPETFTGKVKLVR